MQSISDALGRLHEDAGWFARAHEVRVLWVRFSSDLRASLVKLLPMLEFHADNFSPWVLLEDAHGAADDGWQTRANRVGVDWERRREAFAKEGVELPAALLLPESSAPPRDTPSSLPRRASAPLPAHGTPPPALGSGAKRFAGAARAVHAALRAPLRGVVFVLVPTVVEDATALAAEVAALVDAPGLADCRWVVAVDADQPVPPQIAAWGERALVCDCVIDPAQNDADLAALLASGEGPGAARMGTVWPRGVVPPRRVDDPPEIPREQRDAALRAAGVEPAMLEDAPRLRALVLGAAVAMKQGRGPEAVRMQREARDLCAQLQLHDMAVICQISLASYLSGLNERSRALVEAEGAAEYAAQRGLKQPESQARLATGLLHALAKRLPEAAREYAASARLAEDAGVPSLAIEGWRLAGQLALQAGLEPQAVKSFGEAIRIASGSAPTVVQASGAAEVARRLAAIFRARGAGAQAASLDEQADQMEAGAFGAAVPAAMSAAGASASREA